jgi:hypothetical protein
MTNADARQGAACQLTERTEESPAPIRFRRGGIFCLRGSGGDGQLLLTS